MESQLTGELQRESASHRAEPLGRVERLRDGYVLAFDRQFDYPRSYIWNLLTEPARLAQWLGKLTPGWELGKEYALDMGGDPSTGTVLQLNPPTSLQVTWDDNMGLESILEWRVLDCAGGALLQLRVRSETADFLTEGAAGWQLILDTLDAIAAGRTPGPDADWAALRDAYATKYQLSHTMGELEIADGVTMIHFDRRFEATLPRVKDAVTADPSQQPRVEQAEVDFTAAGSSTIVTVRHVVEDPTETAALMARWHAHLDAVGVDIDGDTPHISVRKLRVLEDFYRANTAAE
ncbi:SRPBCC domain-containing protein [Arthrobacter sp. Sr33]|uniref:SRPBCC domain-containing protein n=2 Tax=unclassified Arthrobacter TaxID=235627 RepID=UPI0002DC3694|nr:SRPBCC domain-containing protein [Arthrobacter sp. TB 23]